MRRALAIFLAFQRDTGHAHPHRDAAIANYTGLLAAMGKTEAEIKATLVALAREAGLDPGLNPRRLCRPLRAGMADGLGTPASCRRSVTLVWVRQYCHSPPTPVTPPIADYLLVRILPFLHSERETGSPSLGPKNPVSPHVRVASVSVAPSPQPGAPTGRIDR